MRLIENEILKDTQTDKLQRILWIDPDNQFCFLIDIDDNNSLPFFRKVPEIIEEIVTGSLAKIKEDPYSYNSIRNLSESNKTRRNAAWEIIGSIVESEPDIYDRDLRGAMIQELIQNKKATKMTIYKYLRKYWQRGKTPNALLPDYHKSGGKGKDKSVGSVKRGRPPIYGAEGINVDESTKKVFRLALEKYYLTTKKNNLKDAFRLMIKEFFAEDVFYENSIERILIADSDKLPTMMQFRYWFKKEYGVEQAIIAREGRRKFEKDYRGLLGSSTFEAIGPGSRFQIDATVADVYLVSSYNPNWIIGRPVLYLVVDVFSRMVAGMYVGLEGPSWMGAMMALANVAANKREYCAQYGIPIMESSWPCENLPEVLLADRGELEGYNIDRLVDAFKLHVENATPYRGDLKGIVEQYFNTIQKRVKPFLPGYVEKDFQQRGARDYRLDAKLTIEQFTQIMIKQVLKHNTKHYLSEYTPDVDMIRDGVELYPINLWNWGIENRSGKLRSFSQDQILGNLLPRENATVTHRGIKFKQMLSSSERAVREGWFSQARVNGTWKVTISYDPRNVSTIFLVDLERGLFEPCNLLEHQETFLGKTFDEVQNMIVHLKLQKKNAEHAELQADVNLDLDIENIVKEAAKKAKEKKDPSLSKSARIKNIKENRRNEREERRKEESFVQPTKLETPAEVVSFTPRQNEEFSRPSIKDFLRKGKGIKEDE